MFTEIPQDRYARISPAEARWLDNIKKAFYHSDQAMAEGQPQDRCLEELFKAIDTAKTLRRSLRGEDTSSKHNRVRFIEFLGLEIPATRPGNHTFLLVHSRTGLPIELGLGDVIYDVRRMTHENENLNAAEACDYHIKLDWSVPNPQFYATVRNGHLTVNGYFLWRRLREVLAKFITFMDSIIAMANGSTSFRFTIWPESGSIKPRSIEQR